MAKLEQKAKDKKQKQARRGAGGKFAANAKGDKDVITSQKAAAKYAKVKTRTIRRWVNEQGMKTVDLSGGKKGYLKTQLDCYKANSGKDASEINIRGKVAEAEFKETKGKLAQIELKLKQGQLVDIDQIQSERIERILEVKRVLSVLPRKIPPLIKNQPVRKQTEIIRREIDHCLKVFEGMEKHG